MLGRDETGGVYKPAMKRDIYPVGRNEPDRCSFFVEIKIVRRYYITLGGAARCIACV